MLMSRAIGVVRSSGVGLSLLVLVGRKSSWLRGDVYVLKRRSEGFGWSVGCSDSASERITNQISLFLHLLHEFLESYASDCVSKLFPGHRF